MTQDKSEPEALEDGVDEHEDDHDERGRAGIGRKIGEGILSGLLEGGAAIRRGQDKVSGVAAGTKEEVLRIVGSEVRGFLDKIDVVDIMQQVVSGLVIDVNAQIRIRRDEDGKLATEVSEQKIKLGQEKPDEAPDASDSGED